MYFDFVRKTLRTQLEADQLYTSIRVATASQNQSALMLGAMYRLCSMLVLTESIGLTDAEQDVPEFREFLDFTNKWRSLSSEEVWNTYLELHPDPVSFWIQGYEKSNKPLLPRHQMDGRLLSPEEKERANDPEDPSES